MFVHLSGSHGHLYFMAIVISPSSCPHLTCRTGSCIVGAVLGAHGAVGDCVNGLCGEYGSGCCECSHHQMEPTKQEQQAVKGRVR